jgi:hypothetical protein
MIDRRMIDDSNGFARRYIKGVRTTGQLTLDNKGRGHALAGAGLAETMKRSQRFHAGPQGPSQMWHTMQDIVTCLVKAPPACPVTTFMMEQRIIAEIRSRRRGR